MYLTEKISRWNSRYIADDGEKKPYHFGFIDFIIDEEESIDGKSSTTFTNERKISEFHVSNLFPDDLMIFAAVFNSDSVKRYSLPPDEGEFNAHYVDAAAATELVPGGDLRPVVSINQPEIGKLHLFGRPVVKTIFKGTVLIGKTKIIVDASDDNQVDHVEIHVDGVTVANLTEAPYEYTLSGPLFFKHTVEAIAFDEKGKTSSVSIDVSTFIFFN